jgi:hypothetical protein
VAVTTDGWSGPKEQSYWSLTLHGIDNLGVLRVAILACLAIYRSHNSKNLANLLRPILLKVGLTEEKMSAWVTDEGGAAPCISDHFHCPSIHCAGHLLQTVLRRAFKIAGERSSVLALIIDVSKTVVKLFNNSSERRQQLSSLQRQHGQSINSLKRDVATRWNSILATLISVSENEMPILNWILNHEMDAKNAHVFLLQSNRKVYWTIINELVSILKLFERATTILSQEKQPTLHLLIPEILSIKASLIELRPQITQNCCKLFMEVVLEQIDVKFLPWNELELMAAALVPSLHHSKFSEAIKPGLKPLNEALFKMSNEFQPASTSSMRHGTQEHIMDAYFDDSSFQATRPDESSISSSNDEHSYHPELQSFLLISRSVDRRLPILQFWSSQRTILPLLSHLAFHILGIPATQTTSERQFSLMRLVFHHLRGSLDPDTANKVLTHSAFIRRRNLDILDQRRVPRSAHSIEADAKRQQSRTLTAMKKAEAREGDNTEPVILDLTALNTTQDEGAINEMEETNSCCLLMKLRLNWTMENAHQTMILRSALQRVTTKT